MNGWRLLFNSRVLQIQLILLSLLPSLAFLIPLHEEHELPPQHVLVDRHLSSPRQVGVVKGRYYRIILLCCEVNISGLIQTWSSLLALDYRFWLFLSWELARSAPLLVSTPILRDIWFLSLLGGIKERDGEGERDGCWLVGVSFFFSFLFWLVGWFFKFLDLRWSGRDIRSPTAYPKTLFKGYPSVAPIHVTYYD